MRRRAFVTATGILLLVAQVLASSSQASAEDLVVRTHGTGFATFEPTLGAHPDGELFYVMADGARGVAIGFRAGVGRSTDDGATWKDVSPNLADVAIPPETNDPYIYVDPSTGRVFQFSMSPILTCAVLSWSDDKGSTWETNPFGCGATAVWDHQTMVAAKPRTLATVGYPNVLHQCVNSVYAVMCSRSLDGGRSFSPSMPVAANTGARSLCGAQHGHLAAAPDGTIYLPYVLCGRKPEVAISKDDGLTWQVVKVSDEEGLHLPDSNVAVDEAGNVYYVFLSPNGTVWLSVSTDGGATWKQAVQANPPGTTGNLPTIAAGGPGKIVLAYAGTPDLPQGFQTPGYRSPADFSFLRTVAWHGYMTISTNADSATPTFSSTTINPTTDPIVRGQCGPGRCPGLVDFVDVQIAANGRPYAAFVDACIWSCVTDGDVFNYGTEGTISTLDEGPLLR